MLWLFVVAIVMPITMGTCEDKNLTSIKWDHAVNSQKELALALKSDSNAIEADVMLGTVKKGGKTFSDEQVETIGAEVEQMAKGPKKKIPIMSHSGETSDLSLEDFLNQVIKYNDANANKTKAAKLDFKQTDALTAAVETILEKKWKTTYSKVPVWINADILPGPVKEGRTPVDATQFFKLAEKLENATLSLGWVTPEKLEDNATYTEENIEAMKGFVIGLAPGNNSYEITYAVRAKLAVKSQDLLQKLLDATTKKFPKTSFTVWSANNDTVDDKEVTKFIKRFGTNKVYLDVPKDLLGKINVNGASSIVQFGIFNMVAIVIALFFSLH